MSTYEEQPGFVPFAQANFEETAAPQPTGALSQMWQTRPVRFPSRQGGHAKVAGVCEGIGIRYQIDPTLVRLAFVVFGVLGAGIAAYLLAWMLMPRYSVPISPLEAIWTPGHPQDRTHGWWLLIIFAVFSGIFTSGAGEFFGSASLLTYVLLGAMWWGLHKKQPLPPRGLLANGYNPIQDPTMTTPNTNIDPTDYPQPQPDLSNMDPVQGYNAPFAQQYAENTPTWAPLAPAQHTWNIQHVPAPPVKKKRRVWPWIVGGFLTAGIASFIVLGATVSSLYDGIDDSTVGDIAVSPTNNNLQDSYTSGVGELDLNLSALTPLEAERSIQVNSGIGEIVVTLPEEIPVNLTCMAGIGTTHCDVEGLNDNANPDSEPLNIHVNSGIGDVRVEYAR